MTRLTLALWVALLGSCATPRTAGLCPGAESTRCLTHRTCTKDASRGCMVCTCDPPLFQDTTRQERSGEDLPSR